MNLTPDSPEMPKGPQKPKAGRSFEDVLRELKPQLEKLPPDQKIPALPPDKMILESVQEFVASHGMVVPESCPPTIAVAGEFLDRSGLREGRTGLHQNVRVVSFLYRFSDKVLRSVVIYPKDGVDARLLGMAIFWGLVADVPASIAQSKILEVKDFFSINAFDLGKIIDGPALERYKAEYRDRVADEWHSLQQRNEGSDAALETGRKELDAKTDELERTSERLGRDFIREHNRAEAWRIAAAFAFVVCFLLAVRWFFS